MSAKGRASGAPAGCAIALLSVRQNEVVDYQQVAPCRSVELEPPPHASLRDGLKREDADPLALMV